MALHDGDPLADALAGWMAQQGMSMAMPLFEQALTQGITTLPNAPGPLREFFAAVTARPAWIDEALMTQGARTCHRAGVAGLYALRDLSLMGGYQASVINQTLLRTGDLTRGTQRRLAETTLWWLNCTAVGGMTRQGAGFQGTLRVRVIHALVRRRLLATPTWSVLALGVPINQVDMQATYLAFSVLFLLGQRALGVPVGAADAHAVMHLWRVIGWAMGVEERWLSQSEADGRVALYQNLLSQAPPDASSAQLGRALMDEPLHRPDARFASLRQRFERARHLSLDRYFLGRAGMQALGMPDDVLPWYPLISAPGNTAWHLSQRLIPGGRDRLARRGRAAQRANLKDLFGGDTPVFATSTDARLHRQPARSRHTLGTVPASPSSCHWKESSRHDAAHPGAPGP
jgi:hypothetical protein